MASPICVLISWKTTKNGIECKSSVFLILKYFSDKEISFYEKSLGDEKERKNVFYPWLTLKHMERKVFEIDELRLPNSQIKGHRWKVHKEKQT